MSYCCCCYALIESGPEDNLKVGGHQGPLAPPPALTWGDETELETTSVRFCCGGSDVCLVVNA